MSTSPRNDFMEMSKMLSEGLSFEAIKKADMQSKKATAGQNDNPREKFVLASQNLFEGKGRHDENNGLPGKGMMPANPRNDFIEKTMMLGDGLSFEAIEKAAEAGKADAGLIDSPRQKFIRACRELSEGKSRSLRADDRRVDIGGKIIFPEDTQPNEDTKDHREELLKKLAAL